MHPIEHLRYVARASGVDSVDLAREAAIALASLRADHANLVIACRRIVERHPDVAQLWWLCAHLLTASDAAGLAWELADRVDTTETADRLASEIPESATVVTVGAPNVIGEALAQRPDVRVWCTGDGADGFKRFLERNDIVCAVAPPDTDLPGGCELVLLEPIAASRAQVLLPAGSQQMAAAAAGCAVWALAAPGTRLPVEYVAAIAERAIDRTGPPRQLELVVPSLLTHVLTQGGIRDDVPAALNSECPYAPELLRTPR